MQRRTFITGLAGVAGAVALPHVRRAGAQSPIIMRFGHYADVNHPGHIAALQFADRVKARTNGAVQINIFPNNALGSPPQLLEQTKLGAIDMAVPTQGQLDKYIKAFGACELPFMFRDYDHAHKSARQRRRHGLAIAARRAAGLRHFGKLGIRLSQSHHHPKRRSTARTTSKD